MKTVLFVVLLLSGCAIKGVAITDDKRKVCEAVKDCTVWTQQELGSLARKAFREGYKAGAKSI